MHQDVQLRADVRAHYNDQRLWKDLPPFEEAERLGTSAYRRALEVAEEDRRMIEEIEFGRCQLALI